LQLAPSLHRGCAGLLAIAALCSSSRANAAPPLDNHYSIDLFQGPILAPIRVTGIGGAYAGYAEGIAGMVANAAAPAVREPFSFDWAELDIAASVSLPFSIAGDTDFDNSGELDYDYSNFIYFTAGGIARLGPFGFGVNGEGQRYTLTANGTTTNVTVGKFHLLGGVRLWGDQLMIGAGGRVATLGIEASGTDLTMAGIAPQLGVLVRPDWKSFRVGATFRFPVSAAGLIADNLTIDDRGIQSAGGLVVPDLVVLPWEFEVGIAVQVGPRPLNPAWQNPRDQEAAVRASIVRKQAERERNHQVELATIKDPKARAARERELADDEVRERVLDEAAFERAARSLKAERRARYWNWPREHLLLTADLLVTGSVRRAVGLDRFLGQSQGDDPMALIPGSTGASVNFSPRFGIETEPIPSRIHTRFGSYYEPSRKQGTVGRQHFTFGADIRLFPTTWWGLVPEVIYTAQASVDIAPRYQSLSFGIGVWR
jgi:hypothetical protein